MDGLNGQKKYSSIPQTIIFDDMCSTDSTVKLFFSFFALLYLFINPSKLLLKLSGGRTLPI